MRTLTVLRGLPGSGKSTTAKRLVEQSVFNTKRVSKDCLREMLDLGNYTEVNEQVVRNVELLVVNELLDVGFGVVIDDTNLKALDVKCWKDVAGMHSAKFVVIELNTSLEVCIARDAEREEPIGEARIREMAERYEAWQES